MVAPVWWLRSLIALTRPLLASWTTSMIALLGMLNVLVQMPFQMSDVFIPCVGKDPRQLQEFQTHSASNGKRFCFQ